MSDVSVLEFHPGDVGYICIIRHPDNEPSYIILNANYDRAIEQFLDLHQIHTKHYQSLNILP